MPIDRRRARRACDTGVSSAQLSGAVTVRGTRDRTDAATACIAVGRAVHVLRTGTVRVAIAGRVRARIRPVDEGDNPRGTLESRLAYRGTSQVSVLPPRVREDVLTKGYAPVAVDTGALDVVDEAMMGQDPSPS